MNDNGSHAKRVILAVAKLKQRLRIAEELINEMVEEIENGKEIDRTDWHREARDFLRGDE